MFLWIPWQRNKLTAENITNSCNEAMIKLFDLNCGYFRGNSDRLFSWTPKSLQTMTTAMKLKDACFLEEKL